MKFFTNKLPEELGLMTTIPVNPNQQVSSVKVIEVNREEYVHVYFEDKIIERKL